LLFVGFGVMPEGGIVWLPVFLAIQVAFTLGVTMIMSAVVVYFRDLRQVLPMVLQLGLFATPVAWEFFDTIPAAMRPIYSAINPLVPVIDGYRKTILFGESPPVGLLGIAAVSSAVVLVVGYLLFKRLETGFADVA
jgi:ABC-2 type transport system permease protein/lipopolysaccharide transport system permease protein